MPWQAHWITIRTHLSQDLPPIFTDACGFRLAVSGQKREKEIDAFKQIAKISWFANDHAGCAFKEPFGMPTKQKKKLDLYQVHKAEYVAPRSPVLVKTGPAKYLAIAGKGEPGSKEFQAKIGALYNVAFTIKMEKKFAGQDYTVCKLEGLWWIADKTKEFMEVPKSQWLWKLMIRVPEFIGAKELKEAATKLREKGKPAQVSEVRLENCTEGLCVQALHVGSYDEEAGTIAKMKEIAGENRLSFHGLHHEIYLSDPRRVAPARLRTILRHPVR